MKNMFPPSNSAHFVGALALLAFALCAPAARADDAATEHEKKARVAYDLQDFAEAIKEFRAAYAAEQKPDDLFGLAQAQRQAKDFAGAIASFKSYKRLEGVTPQQGTAAELLITKCEVEQARAETEASKRADRGGTTNEPVGKAPALAAASPSPAGASTAADNRQTPAPTPRADDVRSGPRHFYSDVLGDSLFIAGLGASGVGAFLLISGNSDMKASSGSGTDASAQNAADSAHSKQVAGAVLLPIGGALLVGSVIRWATVSTRNDDSGPTGLLVGPRYIGYSGQF